MFSLWPWKRQTASADPAESSPHNDESPHVSASSSELHATRSLERIALSSLVENRRTRRWTIALGIVRTLAYVFVALVIITTIAGGRADDSASRTVPHTALIDVHGVIDANGDVDARQFTAGLEDALSNPQVKGIIVHINSPGGSPAQAAEMYDRVRQAREEYASTPIYAVAGDLCASAGYYIASATQEIYANRSSLVGSIGVLFEDFGFTGTLEKLGVERRVYTAGNQKNFLDPYLPLRQEDVAHLQTVLDDEYAQFVDAVKEGRGDRLRNEDKALSGLIWTGRQALELGLVDHLGDVPTVARSVIGAGEIVDYTARPSPWDEFSTLIGSSVRSGMHDLMSRVAQSIAPQLLQ